MTHNPTHHTTLPPDGRRISGDSSYKYTPNHPQPLRGASNTQSSPILALPSNSSFSYGASSCLCHYKCCPSCFRFHTLSDFLSISDILLINFYSCCIQMLNIFCEVFLLLCQRMPGFLGAAFLTLGKNTDCRVCAHIIIPPPSNPHAILVREFVPLSLFCITHVGRYECCGTWYGLALRMHSHCLLKLLLASWNQIYPPARSKISCKEKTRKKYPFFNFHTNFKWISFLPPIGFWSCWLNGLNAVFIQAVFFALCNWKTVDNKLSLEWSCLFISKRAFTCVWINKSLYCLHVLTLSMPRHSAERHYFRLHFHEQI